MTWVIYSLLMFVSSVVLYLLIRRAQQLKISQEIYSFFIFIIPAIGYLLFIFYQKIPLELPLEHIILISITAYFFSYLGNFFSMKGIEKAPNPGYSLIISKSYVVLTAILSVWLFRAELTANSIFAILLIVGFSALISISPKKEPQTANAIWILYSFGAFFCWAGLALMSKYLIDLGVNVIIRLFYVHIFVSGILMFELVKKNISLKTSTNNFVLLVLIGIFSMLFNLFLQLGYEVSPNPGYLNAVNASSITLLTLLSSYFFRDELNTRKMVGVVGVTIGMILLFV